METVAHFSNIKQSSLLYFLPVYHSSSRMSLVALTEKTVDILLGRDLGRETTSLSISFITHTLLSAIGRAYDEVTKLLGLIICSCQNLLKRKKGPLETVFTFNLEMVCKYISTISVE